MIEIKSRYTGAVLYTSATAIDISVALMEGVKAGADLSGAKLRSADLRSANLYGANLYGADLRSANLYGADLRSADLRSADLSGADLSGADLRSANLYGADLYGADLRSANLRSADLSGAKTLPDITCNGKMIQIANVAEWGTMIAYITSDNLLYIWIGCQHKPYADMVTHWKSREDRPMSRVALQMANLWFKAASK